MNDTQLDEDWRVIATLLPHGWQTMAVTSQALLRSRKIPNAETLLRLLLLHISSGLSLRQATVRAREQGLVDISDVALLKRLRSAGPWLQRLASILAAQTWSSVRWPLLPQGYRLRAVDASNLQEPDATGTDWRLHYSLSLPTLACDQLEVTDAHGGESLTRFRIAPKDLLLGDRGYCRAPGLAHVQRAQGHYVVRLHSTAVNLFHPDGRRADLLSLVRTVSDLAPTEWPLFFEHEGERWPVRLCALRRSGTSAEEEKAQARESARKSRSKVSERTLELAEYILVLTSLPVAEAASTQILHLYRLRWQIELAFKRLKSLLHLGQLHTFDDASSRAWLHGKLLIALLIERQLLEAKIFSPWGYPLRGCKPLEPVHRGS